MIPTGDLTDPATVLAMTFDTTDPATITALIDGDPWAAPAMPACEGECGNTAERAHFDAATARFVALCAECEPIPFALVTGGE